MLENENISIIRNFIIYFSKSILKIEKIGLSAQIRIVIENNLTVDFISGESMFEQQLSIHTFFSNFE